LDLNQLYFDHQVSLMNAHGAATPHARRGHEHEAGRIAGRIGRLQSRLGAAAACAWVARSAGQTA